MSEFFVTFGVQYGARVRHPLGMDGDGYAVVEAPDYGEARRLAFQVFGSCWAFLYGERPSERFAPLGELGRVFPDGTFVPVDLAREPESIGSILDSLLGPVI